MSEADRGPVKVGIIGMGHFGRFVRSSLATSRAVSVVAVADQTVAQGEVRSVAALLNDPTIEAVHIATPPNSHASLAVAALEAGKHVVVEKPLALTSAEGRRMRQAAERADKVLAVNFMLRYNPLVEMLTTLLRAQLFGPLYAVRLENVAGRVEPADHWFWDIRKSGGIHIEHGVHFFDLASHWLGVPGQGADGCLVFRGGKNTEAMAMVEFSSGTVARFAHAFVTRPALEHTSWWFVWERGQAVVEGWIPLSMELRAELVAAEAAVLTEHGFKLVQNGKTTLAQWRVTDDKETMYAECVRRLWADVAHALRRGGEVGSLSGEVSLALAECASRRHWYL